MYHYFVSLNLLNNYLSKMISDLFTIVIIISISLHIVKLIHSATRKMYISDVKMTGKVVIITGSNTGIGYATAEDLAKRGAKVILACRDPQKGATARDKMIQSTGNLQIIFKQLDLASFKSVREFAYDIMKTEPRLDVLINNAGTMYIGNYLTVDNLPVEAQVNHFGPFLLTMLLLPLLKSSVPSRIINVSSLCHVFGTIDDIDKQSKYSWLRNFFEIVYNNTKLANMLFTKKLSEVLKDSLVTVNCLHPGAVATDLYRSRYPWQFLFDNAHQGAQTSIYLAVEPSLKSVSGKYFSNCTESVPTRKAQDAQAAEKLWALSVNTVFGSKKTL